MDLITLDFETFYDADYSLSKMTTEAYIRDDRFEVIGLSVKCGHTNPPMWYSGPDVGAFLRQFNWEGSAVCCHNTLFDGAILSWVYGIRPKLWLDTLSMSRPKYAATVGGSLAALAAALGLGVKGTEVIAAKGKRRKDFTKTELAKYGEYCCNDTDLCHGILFELRKDFPVSELMVIDQLIRMYTEPCVELNRTKLQAHMDSERARKLALLNTLGKGDPEAARKVVCSNKQFAELIESLGGVVPTKTSPRTGKATPAFAKTDAGMKELLVHPNPAIAAIAEVRLGVKSSIEETRAERLIGVSTRGPLPIMLNYYAAHTGRLGGGDKLNLQNLPVRTGNAIRDAINAPEGCSFVATDSSQVEARMLALLAGQHDLVEAFRQGRDVYSEFATSVYGYKVDRKSNPDHYIPGFVGKTCILGLGYQMGDERFWNTLRLAGVTIDMIEARRIVYLYRNTYPMIPKLWLKAENMLNDMVNGRSGMLGFLNYSPEGIVLPNGHVLCYHYLRRDENGDMVYLNKPREVVKWTRRRLGAGGAGAPKPTWISIYGGKVIENITQALVRIIITDQMVEIGQRHKVAFQVHDENVAVVPDDTVAQARAYMEEVMSTPPSWAPTLPVACESGTGKTYAECK
jgi:DNA polymerase I-like protein with 3'-5' exonuclease and polymerase domains